MSNANSEYKPDAADPVAVTVGQVSEPGNINAAVEDREAAQSEKNGRVNQREVNDLRSGGDEILSSRTRGGGRANNDAYKAERNLDLALEQEGESTI